MHTPFSLHIDPLSLSPSSLSYCIGVWQSMCLLVTTKSTSLYCTLGRCILNCNQRREIIEREKQEEERRKVREITYKSLIVIRNKRCCLCYFKLTNKSSQAEVRGVLFVIPRNMSSVVTACLNIISYLE